MTQENEASLSARRVPGNRGRMGSVEIQFHHKDSLS